MALNWDTSYEVALALHGSHPDVDLRRVSLADVYEWTMALPAFSDEPGLCNDEILQAIFQEWYEVTSNA